MLLSLRWPASVRLIKLHPVLPNSARNQAITAARPTLSLPSQVTTTTSSANVDSASSQRSQSTPDINPRTRIDEGRSSIGIGGGGVIPTSNDTVSLANTLNSSSATFSSAKQSRLSPRRPSVEILRARLYSSSRIFENFRCRQVRDRRGGAVNPPKRSPPAGARQLQNRGKSECVVCLPVPALLPSRSRP